MSYDRPSRLRAQELLAGRYRLLGPIERAGFGMAWGARDEGSARIVELHDLRTPRGTVGIDEAVVVLKTYGGVKHRALAVTHDAFVHDGGVVAVLASTDGVPLTVWLEERSRVGVAARLDAVRAVIDQVAQGLWGLHRAPGEGAFAHGCFGAPCVRVETRGAHPVVRVEAQGWGQVVAPPGWWVCPPEGEAQTPAADVFALGLLATALLTGESSVHHGDAVRRRFHDHLPEADPTLVDGIAACVMADPTLRVADARAARERLLHAAVSWKPRERPAVSAPPRAPRAQSEDESPVLVQLPARGPQVWLVPAKEAPKAVVEASPAAEPEESTQVEPPRPRASAHLVPAARTPPSEDAAEATVVRAPAPPAPAWEAGDEATDITVGAPEGTAEATTVARPARAALRREAPIDATRVIPTPQDESTDVAPPAPEEQTNPLGDDVSAFAPARGTRDQTLVPGNRSSGLAAFVPEEATAPMGPVNPVWGGGTQPRSEAPGGAADATRPYAVAAHGLPVGVIVAGVVAAGVGLGLVLWWAIR